MDQLISEIGDILEGEIGLYRSLHSVLREEKNAIVCSSLDRIIESGKTKARVAWKLKQLETRRLELIRQVSDQTHIPAKDLTLSKLSRLGDSQTSNRLDTLNAAFVAEADTIASQNRANRKLLNSALEFVKTSLSLLGNMTSTVPVYHQSGKYEQALPRGRVLSNRI